MEGTGSIWNKNSWHWEEKNYNKWSEEWFRQKFSDITLEAFLPFETLITIEEITSLKGSAGLSI